MKLAYALFCDNADRLQDGRLCLFGADPDTFQVNGVPAAVPFQMIAKVIYEDADVGRDHFVSVEIVNPAGERKKLIPGGGIPLKPAVMKSYPEGTMPRGNIQVRMVVNFQNPGIYYFYLLIDDVAVAELPLNITVLPDVKDASQADQPDEGPSI